jgi:hypothetical protein
LGIAKDSSNNVYITGFTGVSLDTSAPTNQPEVFVIKYNNSGTKQWSKQMGTDSGPTQGNGIAIDSNANVFVTGVTNGNLDGNTRIGTKDLFVTNKLKQ